MKHIPRHKGIKMINLSNAKPFGLREKLLLNGVNSLSDTELLALFISSGSKQKSCLQLAYELLKSLGDLRSILNADLNTFKSVKGLGDVRFVQLKALQEICRRSDFISLKNQGNLGSTDETYLYFKRKLRDKKNETFAALFLDSQHRILAYEELFSGTIDKTTIHTRPIIEKVFKLNAAAIIFAHNHPSGIALASKEDILVTELLNKALQLIDVRLLDHLVIGDNQVYSIIHKLKWEIN